ncbi:MAG: AAA family ATPase [Ignavibacteriaceae bacterium]|nr:AAA family ATPase [Ignavibacteriaceae bacterium]
MKITTKNYQYGLYIGEYMFSTYSIMDILRISKQAPKEIIKNGILPENSILLLSGQPKARKSFLVFNLALAIAAGKSFACFEIPKPKRVLLLSAEGGDYSNSQRLGKMYEHIHGIGDLNKSLENNLSISFLPKLWINDTSDRRKLMDKIEEINPDVLILDPLIRFHDADENSAKEMSEVFSCLRTFIACRGPAY